MNISSIVIKNILGIKEYMIKPGSITAIEGRNASGKSSIINAIRAALGSADFAPAQLLHQGAEEGEVVLVFDDGTTVQRKIKDGASTVKVTDKEGNKFGKPQSLLDSLYRIAQVNPMKLLLTDKKSRDERSRVILEAMHFTFGVDDIVAIAPAIASQAKMIDTQKHGLLVLDEVESRLFERRQDVNRQVKIVKGNIEKIQLAILEAEPADAEASLPMNDLLEAQKKLNAKMQEYITLFNTEKQTVLDQLNKERAEYLDAWAVRVAKVQQETADKITQKQIDFNARIKPVEDAIAKAESSGKLLAVVQSQKDQVAGWTQEHAAWDSEAEMLTAQIEAVRARKLDEASKLPIEGLSIVDGELVFFGLPFDSLNTAQRISLAVKVAAMAAGELKVVCVDGCEALDSEQMVLLEEACTEAGLQMICTTVTDSDLQVKVV